MMRPENVTHIRGVLGARASRPPLVRARRPRSRLLVLVAAAFLFGGCQRGPVKTELDPNEKHILKIVSLYMDFRSAHPGRGPKDAQELKNWAKQLKKEKLTVRGIEDLDDAFISPRDKQPYVLVKPESARAGPGGRPPMLWVYEKTGVNGKRMGANPMGYAFEMDETDFKKMLPAGH